MSDTDKTHTMPPAGNKEKSKFVRDFSRVIMTLGNIVIPDENLSPTPSMIDGLTEETEMDLRILGCELIQTAGILLKLPQVAVATGQVLFQRFYYSKSFVKHGMEVVVMACIYLASKIEDDLRGIQDVVNVFHHIKQFKQKKTFSPMILDQNYINLKNQVIKSERHVLKELGFCVHVKHPHKANVSTEDIIVMYLQVLEAERNQRLLQCAWNYMNDSYRTNVFVRFNPETIASACIYLAARHLQIPLPNNPHWFLLFGVGEQDIRCVCRSILQLYKRSKPNANELERIVGEIKKQHIEAKELAAAAHTATPNSTSAPDTPEEFGLSPSCGKKSADHEKQDSITNRKDQSLGARRKRSRSRSRSRSAVKKLRSDDSGEHKSQSYHCSSRSRSRSPRSKGGRQQQQHSRHTSKKDDYLSYSRQKPVKYEEKYSRGNRDWKKRKHSSSRSRSRSPRSKGGRQQQQHSRHTSKKDDYLSYSHQKPVKYEEKYSSSNRDWKKRKHSSSRSPSPRSKGGRQQQQHSRHTSKKDDYLSYSHQKPVKYEEKYSSSNRDWKKRKHSSSRSPSPRSKGGRQQQQHSRHTSKKDDYLSYSHQKPVKYEEKYSSSNRNWKKRKSSSNSRSETTTINKLSTKYSKYPAHDGKKDRYPKYDTKNDNKYERRTKYVREDASPPNSRAYSSSRDRLTAAKKKYKHKSKTSFPDERTDSKKRNGQSRVGHSNHDRVQG